MTIAFFGCGVTLNAVEFDFSDREALESQVIEDGVVTLRWDLKDNQVVDLQQSVDAEFSSPLLRYRGSDPGSVVTGLPEGTHYFRIRVNKGEWSPLLAIQVVYFSEETLWRLLTIGGVVVLATIVTILVGSVQARRREDAS